MAAWSWKLNLKSLGTAVVHGWPGGGSRECLTTNHGGRGGLGQGGVLPMDHAHDRELVV